MNILLHLSPLASVGGCEINCLRLIESLPSFRHHVLIFGDPGPMDERWRNAGAQVDHLSAWSKSAWVFKKRLRQWAETQAAPMGVYYWSVSRLPFIINALALWDIPWGVHLGNPLRLDVASRLRFCLWRFCGARTSAVTLIACSDYVAKSYRKAAFFDCFNIVTIYNPVAENFDVPRLHRALQSKDNVRMGMVARLDSIKDHATIIRAIPLLLREWPFLVVEFAGGGDRYEFLVQLARDLGIGDHVRFLGSVNDIKGLLATWDIYLHSTTPNEGMGIAAAEAMMAGLPCVLSEIAVMREVGGENEVIYAEPSAPGAWAKSVGELLVDLPARTALGAAAQRRARILFGSEAVAKAYLGVLTQHD